MTVTPGARLAMRRRSALALALAVPFAVTACGSEEESADSSSGSGAETTAITVGVIPIIDVAPIYLGKQEGFFDDEGLDLTLETAQGGAAIVPGVVSGQYQFGFSNAVSLLLASSQGLPLKAVANGVASTGVQGADFGGVIVPADSDVQGAADLAGKKVGVNTLNNINTTTINKAVSDAGGDPSSIEYVELAFPDIVAAVASGDVDAGQVVEPFLTIAKNSGDRDVVSNYAATDPDLTVSMYFTTQDYSEQNAEVVQKFTAAMDKSLQYARDNPDAVREVLSTYTDLEADVQAAVVLPGWPTEIDADSVGLLAGLAESDGLVPSAPDVDALLP